MNYLKSTTLAISLISLSIASGHVFAAENYSGSVCQHQGAVFGNPWNEQHYFNQSSDYNNVKVTRYGFENSDPVIVSGFLRGAEISGTEAAICPFNVKESVGSKLKVTVVLQDLHKSSRCRGTIRSVDGGPVFTGSWVENSDTTSTTYAKVVVMDEPVSSNGIGLTGSVECELAGQQTGDGKLSTIRAIKLD